MEFLKNIILNGDSNELFDVSSDTLTYTCIIALLNLYTFSVIWAQNYIANLSNKNTTFLFAILIKTIQMNNVSPNINDEKYLWTHTIGYIEQ